MCLYNPYDFQSIFPLVVCKSGLVTPTLREEEIKGLEKSREGEEEPR